MGMRYKTCLIAAIILTASLCSVSVGSETEEIKVIVERNVPVPMRDGTILRADVHRPDGGGPYPVLVQRKPYGKDGNFDRFVKAGYIVVSQDTRGRYESEGKWESFYRFQTHDAEDGYDTIEWAARLSGSTGKVGTFGVSYAAFLQWRLASLCPPSLVAMCACSIPAEIWYGEKPCTIRPGIRLRWLSAMALDMLQRENMPGVHNSWETDVLWDSEKWLNWLPWLELPDDFFGYETKALKDWLALPYRDPWKLHEGCKNILVPNLDIVGWYDHANGDMLLFRTMVKEAKTDIAREGSRIIIGPWTHGPSVSSYGNIDFGADAALDREAIQIQWFDYWLKGKSNGIDKDPPVRIFIMGDNEWRGEQSWPLQRTKEKTLFITSSWGNANTPSGDGKLVGEKPEHLASDKYVYDPRNPVPTPYGTTRPIPVDQRSLANRLDILVYQFEPLTERLEVTGNPVVELYASSSAHDTDWFVRLIDVTPDGLAWDVSSGMVRARYRHGFDKPELIQPDEVIKYTIRMIPTSHAFLPGHRIRLDISSSDFPNYDRNHNTAADQNADATLVVANQTIYHGGRQATRIILPWVPNSTQEEKPAKEEKPESVVERQIYPLHQAAGNGGTELVRQLLSQGADINARDNNGRTPLYTAVASDEIEIARLLIAEGADINAKNKSGLTPLHRAVGRRNNGMVKLLIAQGADMNADDNSGRTPLYAAVASDRMGMAQLLIAQGADINAKNSRGLTALHRAAVEGRRDVAEFLLAEGAKVDGRDDSYQFTALHYAARFENKDVAEVLIANGADINAKDKWDYQPIHWAAYHDRPEIIELLIAKGADVNAKTSLDQTPLELAIPRRNTGAIEVLRKHGAEAGAAQDASGVVSKKPYVVLERGDIRAVIVNNEPVDDDVLPGHRGGYSGVASLTHHSEERNLFVPLYAGLNFEHIHDGTTQAREILFEPRQAPMEMKQIDKYTVGLHQPPTPHWQLESWLRYQLLEDSAIEMTLECMAHARTFKNDYIGLFFASYIDQPESLDIHFLGHPTQEYDTATQWIRGVTPAHGELSTHLAIEDNRTFAHDPDFPLTLVFNRSNYRYSEPWYYGVSHGMAFVLMFRPSDRVRLSQSPSGGGKGNPAWDFQWFIPLYQVGERYCLVMRAMYLPFESREQIIQATTPHWAALGQSRTTVTRPSAAEGPDKAVPEGFTSLFNGINLDGWIVRQPENQDWQVVDGVIDCDPHEGRGDKNLWTIRSYSDFELLVDWRIKKSPYVSKAAKIILPDGTYKKDDSGNDVLIEVPNTDSGIFLRGRHKSQVNIWCWPVGSGEVWGYRTDPACSPEVHAGLTPRIKADRPIGEWNTFHIVMKGDRLTVALNGTLVIDNAQLPGVPAQGSIALQHHGDRRDGEWGASFLQFRRIYIKELNRPANQ